MCACEREREEEEEEEEREGRRKGQGRDLTVKQDVGLFFRIRVEIAYPAHENHHEATAPISRSVGSWSCNNCDS